MNDDGEARPLRWSGSFRLAPEDSYSAQSTASGDKIILPSAALEQLLTAASLATSNRDNARSYTQSSSLFHSSSQYEDASQKLPNPLVFRLVHPTNGSHVYAGIREFSAPDDTIILSPYLLNALGIDDGKDGDTLMEALEIKVHAEELPKGTYARLRPLEAGYNPDDWRPLLERQLRNNFTSLTKDTHLVVNGVRGEKFQLLVDKLLPDGPGVCVVDTDLEVDIEALNEEQARETMRQLIDSANGSGDDAAAQGGELSIWKDATGTVKSGSYVDYVLPSWDRTQTLHICVSDLPDDALIDLFVTPKSTRQRALPRSTEHVFGNFEDATQHSKTISILPTNIQLEHAESILISVYTGSYSADKHSAYNVPYKIRARMGSTPDNTLHANDQQDTMNHETDSQCTNCKKWLPKQKLVLHEAFCRRNNVLCTRCGSVFQKNSTEWDSHWHCDHDDAFGNSAISKKKHDDVFHKDWQCPGCPFATNSLPDLARHRTTMCPQKIILCQFCHLEVPQEGDPFQVSPEVALSGLTAHELADGARTTECHLCGKIVRLRDMETHLKHHELDKVGRADPAICRNANCGRTLFGVGSKGLVHKQPVDSSAPANDIGLCSICFGPLYVSMHDPEGKALRRRIERRYLGQLMTGCGKSHCQNEWCKSGRANTKLEALGSSAKDALAAVKPLMAALPNLQEPVMFCVDESSQRQRKLAEMLASEQVWSLPWCIAASEAEKGQLDRMQDWLQSWAPRK
ncbi:hypothetical protein VHEMI00027 [[Torrubiella] hemipterigena]|uniref:Uncharacterized protein n=1 Tax=[Torrubiella] hemipterigena TaxID=1531966 RepID=A0A0A1SI42_9HYPO|nr:hypothetical protein VHEMI00027 [[Torrubiella] hemipterigena]